MAQTKNPLQLKNVLNTLQSLHELPITVEGPMNMKDVCLHNEMSLKTYYFFIYLAYPKQILKITFNHNRRGIFWPK